LTFSYFHQLGDHCFSVSTHSWYTLSLQASAIKAEFSSRILCLRLCQIIPFVTRCGSKTLSECRKD